MSGVLLLLIACSPLFFEIRTKESEAAKNLGCYLDIGDCYYTIVNVDADILVFYLMVGKKYVVYDV
jgi:hypothetical protein